MHAERFIALGMTALMALSGPALAASPEKAPMRYSALMELEHGVTLIDSALNADPELRPSSPEMGLTTITFQSLDADANGRVTKEEFEKQGLTESLFTTIDTDHDGALSQGEVDTHGPVMKPVQ
ncbi:MAG TPA: EF-hand domain-containing protein [Patescibacteria group bacterium]|nr:EF-hand domain-containing protein [Patescibacteria group bacterium]